MITVENPPTTPPKARSKITYTWEEYLEIIRMMDDGNPMLDDFEVIPPKVEA
jgi:hypothetical protein